MANAYATFANRGIFCTPVAIESITDPHGKALAVPKSKCDRAMSTETADTINTLLRGVVDSGTGERAGLSDRDSAGKTGTTDGRYNAWFVGYTPNISGAVWVGSGGAKKISMENIVIGGKPFDKVFGGGLPGPIWKDAISGALSGRESGNFTTVGIPEPNVPLPVARAATSRARTRTGPASPAVTASPAGGPAVRTPEPPGVPRAAWNRSPRSPGSRSTRAPAA